MACFFPLKIFIPLCFNVCKNKEQKIARHFENHWCMTWRHTCSDQSTNVNAKDAQSLLLATEKENVRKWVTSANIFLPHCLATGIWTMAQKANTGSKCQGISFGTTLWLRRPVVLFLWFLACACAVFLELNFLPHAWRTNISVGLSKY